MGDVIKIIDTFTEDIKSALHVKDARIAYLESKNKEMRDKHYKDESLLQMSDELNKMKEDYYRGFPISEKEQKSIRNWMDKHEKEVHNCNTLNDKLKRSGCCGGTYTYEFVPTSIGTIGTIKCSCGATFTFQDI